MLKEEMRQMVVSLQWSASQWDQCGEVSGFTGHRAEGARAYAACQAGLLRDLARCFEQQWLLHEEDVGMEKDFKLQEDHGEDDEEEEDC